MTRRYAVVIDLGRCVGCHTCSIACKAEHNIGKGSGIRVETVGGAHPDTPAGKFPDLTMHYLPMPCMHCEFPPCVDACPTGAIGKREDGIVLVEHDKCNGCQSCLDICPYNALLYDPQTNLVWKCTLCAHRIDQGLEPFCVRCCEIGAMFFGDQNDLDSIVSKHIAQGDTYTIKPELGTKPSVHYKRHT